MASSFRVLNSSTRIPSHPLPLLTAGLPKAHLTLLSRMSGPPERSSGQRSEMRRSVLEGVGGGREGGEELAGQVFR